MASKPESPLAILRNNAIYSTISDAFSALQERRAKLGLHNPGTLEKISSEIQRDVLVGGSMFSGLRADVNKALSLNPYMVVSHQVTMTDRLKPYTLAAMYGTENIWMQGTVDNEGSVSATLNYRTFASAISRARVQIDPNQGQMAEFEHEHTGSDFTASLKCANPSFLHGGLAGAFIGQYFQSVTPRVALGLETAYQRMAANQEPMTAVSYFARYKSDDWLATMSLRPAQMEMNLGYWRRISKKCQTGVDMTLGYASPSGGMMMGGPPQKEGTTQIGVKYDFAAASFRAQVDTKGKLLCLFERRIALPVTMSFATELDHATQQAKIGISLSIEAGSEEDPQVMATQSPPNIPI